MERLKGHYRKYRFPSIRAVVPTGDGSEFAGGYEEGLESGREKGFDEGIQEGLMQGREQGRKEGFDHGYQEGLSSGKSSFEDAIGALAGVADAFEEARSQRAKDHVDLICNLVEQVAKRVIKTELMMNPDQILKMIEDSLGQLDTSADDQAIIYLSEEDSSRLKKQGVSDIQGYAYKADKALSTGACRIETSSQEIDVSTEKRVDQCMETVKESLEDDSDES